MQRVLKNVKRHRCFSSKTLDYKSYINSSMLSKKWDYIIIGGGHNGLVCANYLVKENPQSQILIA